MIIQLCSLNQQKESGGVFGFIRFPLFSPPLLCLLFGGAFKMISDSNFDSFPDTNIFEESREVEDLDDAY